MAFPSPPWRQQPFLWRLRSPLLLLFYETAEIKSRKKSKGEKISLLHAYGSRWDEFGCPRLHAWPRPSVCPGAASSFFGVTLSALEMVVQMIERRTSTICLKDKKLFVCLNLPTPLNHSTNSNWHLTKSFMSHHPHNHYDSIVVLWFFCLSFCLLLFNSSFLLLFLHLPVSERKWITRGFCWRWREAMRALGPY